MRSVYFVSALMLAGCLASSCASQGAATGSHVAPVVIHRVDASLPEELKGQQIRGSVVLSGTVPKEGGVLRNIKVVSSDNQRLNQAALDAVSQWIWQAGKQNGEPVDVEFTTTVSFN